MPKNKGKGGKNRRRGKNENEVKRELVFKEDGQVYGQVVKMLGNGRLEAHCFDGKKRLCHIRGKMRKKVWGDVILLGLREYQDDKADVILKYTLLPSLKSMAPRAVRYMADEARSLKQYGEIPDTVRVNDADVEIDGEEGEMNNEDLITFDDVDGAAQGLTPLGSIGYGVWCVDI